MEIMSTQRYPVAERFDAYRAAISDAFVPLEATIARGVAFEAVVNRASLGEVVLSDVAASGHSVMRTQRAIRSGDAGYYKLGLQVSGYSVVSQDGREAALTPGDFALYDTSRPYTLSFDRPYRLLVVMFPRALLRLPEQPMSSITARRVSGRQGIGALVSPFLVGMGRQITATNSAVDVHLGQAVLDLLAATFAEQLELESQVTPETHRRALMLRIRSFVGERLGDPGLNPAAIAAANHISVRYLHRLFESEGETVNGWIRRLRMDHCRRDLVDPLCADIPVSAIASRWGVPNAAHFSRVFKAMYGKTPLEYRLAGSGL